MSASLQQLETVIYIPSTNTIYDFVHANGLTHYGNKSLEQIKQQKDCGDAVLMPYDEAHALYVAKFIQPVSEITQDRFIEMLEVLPPCKWQGCGDSFESFHVSERITANIVNWFVRIGANVKEVDNARYFTLSDASQLTRNELHTRVMAFITANG